MVLPTEITVKEDKNHFEEPSRENASPEDCVGPDDVSVKIEIETHFGLDSEDFVETDVMSDFSSFSDNCYEHLIDYCEQRCPVCQEKFWESYSLLRHNLTHLDLRLQPIDNVNQCPVCEQYFVDQRALEKHVELTHRTEEQGESIDGSNNTEKKFYRCDKCDKHMTKYKNWHAHMTEVHSNGQFTCELCNITFKCLPYLRKHMKKRHLVENKAKTKAKSTPITDVKPVICEICSTALRSKNALKTHIRNCHSAEKVQCHICKSVLSSQSYLYAHMRRVHYDDGHDYICDCGKSFKSPRYLRVHIKNSHTRKFKYDENKVKTYKKYKCDCGKWFTTRKTMTRHAETACRLKKSINRTPGETNDEFNTRLETNVDSDSRTKIEIKIEPF